MEKFGRLSSFPVVDGRLAQLVRAAGLHPAGRRFESCSAHFYAGIATVFCHYRRLSWLASHWGSKNFEALRIELQLLIAPDC